jgi:hypothetical protein
MRKMTFVGWLSTLMMALSAVVVAAQPATCTPLLESALEAMSENCADIARNNVCYGYNRVEATFARADFPAEQFSQPADITELVELSTISTAPLDELADEWGVALMRVQANLPGTLPGQNVTFVLMGDVQMANDGTAENPMQAFYFTTGVGNPNCVDSPNALIVQSPQGVQVELTVNGAAVSLASTAFLTKVETPQGVPGIELTMAEGEAVINDTMIVPEGHWALLPVEDTLLDDTFPVTTAERALCRPTPEMHRDNFEAILNLLPEVSLPEAVDNIDTDERGCHIVHTVSAGENLFRIGQQYGVDFNEIAAYNELPSAQQINVGQTLLIPVVDDLASLGE